MACAEVARRSRLSAAFCLRRKSTAERLGRSPGLRGCRAVLCARITFPGLPSGLRDAGPRLQWRDRAGFAPDFPVRPVVGAQSSVFLYHVGDTVATDRPAYLLPIMMIVKEPGIALGRPPPLPVRGGAGRPRPSRTDGPSCCRTRACARRSTARSSGPARPRNSSGSSP